MPCAFLTAAVLPLPGSLLHLLIGNKKSYMIVADYRAQPVSPRQIAFKAPAKAECRRAVGVVLLDRRIEIAVSMRAAHA